MSVSRFGYYKWKYRQEHPTTKMISRQSDIDLIKEIHKKHPSHGYRWINAYARNKYGVVWSNNHVHLCCKYENIINIIDGINLMKNMKNLIILYGMDGNI